MKFELEEIKKETKDLFNRLNELYQYDFSEYYLDDVDNKGIFGHYKYFDLYFTEEKRHAYYIKVEGKYAGFVLVNNYPPLTKDKDTNSIAEFFILKKYRRYKIGTDVALQIFNMFPGKWEFKVLNRNIGGMKFWKNLMDEHVKKYTVNDLIDKGMEDYTKEYSKSSLVNNENDFTVYSFVWNKN